MPPIDTNEQYPAIPPANQPVEPTETGPPAVRIEALKKNLAYLWEESLILTGLPLDTLLAQVFKNAGQQNLKADGHMINIGGNSGFMPNPEVLAGWLESYFARVMTDATTMPEA